MRHDTEFDRLYDRYWVTVYNFCRRLCGHEDDAQDLAQEVFLKLCVSMPDLRDPGAARGWLIRVAVSLWLKRRKASVSHISLKEAEDRGEPAVAYDPWPAEEQRRHVERLLGRLPEEQRLPLILVKLEGLSYAEAAQLLGGSEGLLRWRVFEGLRKLGVMLGVDPPRKTGRSKRGTDL